MNVHETRSSSHAHASSGDEEKVMTRKQKAENRTQEAEQHSPKKKAKQEKENDSGHSNGKPSAAADDMAAEFEQFCKATSDQLSVEQMREIFEANGQDSSGSDIAVAFKCQDMLFYGPLERCPVCNGNLEFDGKRYTCKGMYSEWSSCTFRTNNPPRKDEPLKLPDSVLNSAVSDQYWRSTIEKHGATCLVASPAERERGGSSKLVEAMERGVRVVREAWLVYSIEKQEAQPLEAYDLVGDLAPDGRGIPWDMMDPSEEALESIAAEVKLYGKRSVYKDTKLQAQSGEILEKDGILYNCAFSLCDQGRQLNEYYIMQLITVPESNLNLYYKKGKVGDNPNAEERLEEWTDVENAIKEFVKLFEEVTGNEFRPWEKEKKFQKKPLKFYPIDMDDGIDVRHGGLAMRQLGVAATHCKLEPLVANFMKVLCSQEIYRYALMEMGLDPPDLLMGMLSAVHLKRCEEVLLQFIEAAKSVKETGQKAEAVWTEYSNRWFTLMHSTRPFIFRDYQELADHVAAPFESIRDITVASHLIGEMSSGSTLDDPLSDRYNKLGCSISLLEKDSDDYKMILNNLERTYAPIKLTDIEYGVSVDNVFAVESSACPSLDEMKKLPNKVLLWCGTQTSNLLRHLHKGFLPAVCCLPVPGYMFGKAIVCSDAAAEAARYGFTAVDKSEGFLVLAVASLGDEVTEFKNPPDDTKCLAEKKVGVKGLGRKKTDESEHFFWKEDIKVPCGRLIPSEQKESPLEYNEYAVYDPKQTSIRFLVGVKFAEK